MELRIMLSVHIRPDDKQEDKTECDRNSHTFLNYHTLHSHVYLERHHMSMHITCTSTKRKTCHALVSATVKHKKMLE